MNKYAPSKAERARMNREYRKRLTWAYTVRRKELLAERTPLRLVKPQPDSEEAAAKKALHDRIAASRKAKQEARRWGKREEFTARDIARPNPEAGRAFLDALDRFKARRSAPPAVSAG